MTIPYDNMSSRTRSEQLFSKCCCCIPLRVGCLILGYLNVLINAYHTLALITLTTFLGIYSNGFDHVDPETTTVAYEDDIEDEKSLFTVIGLMLIFVIIVNVLWLIINIACLVGVHKRRAGPVRAYISFATLRLFLSITSFMHLVSLGKAPTDAIITYSIEIAFAAYFLLVYYMYVKQLVRENQEAMEKSEAPINDIPFVYPAKVDKELLVA